MVRPKGRAKSLGAVLEGVGCVYCPAEQKEQNSHKSQERRGGEERGGQAVGSRSISRPDPKLMLHHLCLTGTSQQSQIFKKQAQRCKQSEIQRGGRAELHSSPCPNPALLPQLHPLGGPRAPGQNEHLEELQAPAKKVRLHFKAAAGGETLGSWVVRQSPESQSSARSTLE